MARLGYNVPQSVMDDYSEFYGTTEYTGLSFIYSDRFFMTCTCGLHKEGFSPFEVCPQCGGKIVDTRNNKLLRNYYSREKNVISKKKNTFSVDVKKFTLSYDSKAGQYRSSLTTTPLITGTLSPARIKCVDPAKACRGGIQSLCDIPEFAILKSLQKYMNPSQEEVVNGIMSLADTYKITVEDVDRSPYLYGKYFSELATCAYPDDFEEFLHRRIGIDKGDAVKFAASNNISCQYYWGGYEKLAEVINYLFSGKMGIGKFILELISRGVYKIDDAERIVNMHKKLCEKTLEVPILVGPQEVAGWRKEEINVDKHLVEDFEWFCKKYSFMQSSLAEVFAMRVATLRFLGAPLVQDNFVDRRYYGLINAAKFVYKGENFEEDFEKNPFEALKKMK